LKAGDPYGGGPGKPLVCTASTELEKARRAYSDIEIGYSFLVFNYEDNQFSKIPGDSEYSKWISEKIFKGEYESVEKCIGFLSKYDLTHSEIDLALSLHRLPEHMAANGDPRVAEELIQYAFSASKSQKQCNASIRRLLEGPSEYNSESIITDALLKFLLQYPFEWNKDISGWCINYIKHSAISGDYSLLKELIKMADRIPTQIVKDLFRIGLPVEHKNKLLGIEMMSGSSADTIERYIESLNSSLATGSGLRDLLELRKYLSEQERIALPGKILGNEQVKEAQVLLICEAVDLLMRKPNPVVLHQVSERAMVLFQIVTQEKRVEDAQAILDRVLFVLSGPLRKSFIAHCLYEGLEGMWPLLFEEKEKNRDFVQRWLGILLGEEMMFTLGRDEAVLEEMRSPKIDKKHEELSRALHEINPSKFEYDKVKFKYDKGRRTGPAVLVWDKDNNEYSIRVAGTEIQVWAQTPEGYNESFWKILDSYSKHDFPHSSRSLLRSIVVDELKRKKVRLLSPYLFRLLCDVVVPKSTRGADTLRLSRELLVPLIPIDNDNEYARILLVAICKRMQGPSGLTFQSLKDFLRYVDIELSIEDLRAIYPEAPSDVLFELYTKELSRSKRDEITELVELIKDPQKNGRSFDRLAETMMKLRREKASDFIRELLVALNQAFGPNSIPESFFKTRFPKLLEIYRTMPQTAEPPQKFVSRVQETLKQLGMKKGLDALAKSCVDRMAAQKSREKRTEAEDNIMAEWLDSKPATGDQAVVNRTSVFLEIRRFHCGPNKYVELSANRLNEFRTLKSSIERDDFIKAAKDILSKVRDCRDLGRRKSWDFIEEIARRDMNSSLDKNFRDLIAFFLAECADDRDDYLELLAQVTLRWIGNWKTYKGSIGALTMCFYKLEGRKAARYKKYVQEGLADLRKDAEVQKGINWWQDLVDVPDIKSGGFFKKLFSR